MLLNLAEDEHMQTMTVLHGGGGGAVVVLMGQEVAVLFSN